MTLDRLTAGPSECYKQDDCRWVLAGDKALINSRHSSVLSKLHHQPLRMIVTYEDDGAQVNSGLPLLIQQLHPEISQEYC